MATLEVDRVLFKNILAVLFDKDGTLEDSRVKLTISGQARSRLLDSYAPGIGELLLKEFGITPGGLDPAGLMAVGSRQENEIAAVNHLAKMGWDWPEALQLVRHTFAIADRELQALSPAPLFEDCLPVLKSLSAFNLKLGILSAASSDSVQGLINRYDLAPYLQLAMGVDTGPSKPDPRLFYQACQGLGVSPATTIMIGDASVDMQMARDAGAAGCVGIARQGNIPQLLKFADVVIQHLTQIQVISRC
ncbi:MAG: HAD family hydrolase [Oscillatoriales cyanobacterium RM2_1_1]|nr:HAD family hydrolase [Oscillatoriales cyanobacterium SM2_3_0]NJO47909.1 HAD family hydrolase [Oscillatoriales cyanobacterium RM2_1_1]